MKAHTIATTAPVGARVRTKGTIVPGGILALSLAVALMAATASTASTTPTPPAPPLTLDLRVAEVGGAFWREQLKFFVTTNNDSTLVASGGVKRTVGQLAAGEATKIKARPKHMQQLAKIDEKNLGKPKVKIKFAATDEFGQTATEVVKLKLLVHAGRVIVVHHDAL